MIRISSLDFIHAKLMATKWALGTIAVNPTTPAAILRGSIIHGMKQHILDLPFSIEIIAFQSHSRSINQFQSNYRCFVGEGPDQWRTCSDRYYPNKSGSSHIGHGPGSTSNSPFSNKNKVSAITYSPNKPKGDTIYHQDPPRPGNLQSLEDIASARLWPITYLYSSGPPNSTELSNFVDCNKESC